MKSIKKITPPKPEDNTIRIPGTLGTTGHQPHRPGCGPHDPRERRCRTRQQQLRRATEEE